MDQELGTPLGHHGPRVYVALTLVFSLKFFYVQFHIQCM